jgi:hypothetical protein
MSTNLTSIDINTLKPSNLFRIVEEVNTTKTPRILKRDSEPVAMLMPVGIAVKRSHPQERTIWTHYDPNRVRVALQTSAGALQGVDREESLNDLAVQRGQESTGARCSVCPI